MSILQKKQKLGAAALLLAASAFLSRLMGLIRDKIISWQFGVGEEADLYFAAFVVPDMINYLLAGAFMSITILPLLAKGFDEDSASAWRFFSCILLWMAVGSIALTGLGEIFSTYLAKTVAPGFSAAQCERLVFFMRIILPGQVFFLCGSCFTALLLLRRQFTVPALTPLVYNGCIILFGVLWPYLPLADRNSGMTGYCVGVTLGAALGALALPLFAAGKGELKLCLTWKHPWLRKFFFIALPLMLGQTVVMLDEQFLRVFGSMLDEGGVSALNYGRRISQVPVALMGQAIAAASYPFLVRLLAENDFSRFNKTLNSALSAGLGLIIPCALLMIATARPILGIIFQGGRFSFEDTIFCEPITQILLGATPFWILYMVVVRAFYAMGDTLTPAITGTIATLVCIPLYYLLAVPLGAWAIAAVSGAGVAVYSFWLLCIWIHRQGNGAFAGLTKLCCKCLIFSLPGFLSAWYLTSAPIQALPPESMPGMIVRLAGSSAIFILCLLAMARIFDKALFTTFVNAIKRKN